MVCLALCGMGRSVSQETAEPGFHHQREVHCKTPWSTHLTHIQLIWTLLDSSAYIIMASSASLPSNRNHDFTLPIPPPLLHTRTGSDLGDRPLTPGSSENAFVSPTQTPQGSPSKNKMPPGAFDLPDVFSNAMKLFPTMGSGNKGPKQQSPTSPNKSNTQQAFENSIPDLKAGIPGSPTRKSNKENTPPARPAVSKETNFVSQAAASRQDPYRSQDAHRPASPTRTRYAISPTQEELEKLQKTSVKRMANVTQLCESGAGSNRGTVTDIMTRLSRLLL